MCEYPYTLGVAKCKRSPYDKSPVSRSQHNSSSKQGKLSPLYSGKIDQSVVFKRRMNIGGKNFLIEMHQGRR